MSRPRFRATVLAALVPALVALLAFGPSGDKASAAFTGTNGKIAFVRAGDIWVVTADGSNPTRMTTHPASDRSPRFSPDGTRIAFASNRDGDFEIFVMSARGGDAATQLTFNEGDADRIPSWTADGTKIVYDKNFAEIYVVPADGTSAERKIADGFVPGTSPRGDKVVFATPTNGGLVTMHLDGSEQRQITTGPALSANWSPNGNALVFTGSNEDGRDVYLVHSDGSALQRLTSSPERVEFTPVWSPEGERIAFVGCSPPAQSCHLFVMAPDGSGETQVAALEVTGGEGAVDWQPLEKPLPEWRVNGALLYKQEVVAGDLLVSFEERGLNRFAAVDYRLDGTVSIVHWCGGQGLGHLESATSTVVGLVPDDHGRVTGSLTLEPGAGTCGCCTGSVVLVDHSDLTLTNLASGQEYRLDPIGETFSS